MLLKKQTKKKQNKNTVTAKQASLSTVTLCKNHHSKKSRSTDKGTTKDNPSIYDFGCNDDSIWNHKIFKPLVMANVRD